MAFNRPKVHQEPPPALHEMLEQAELNGKFIFRSLCICCTELGFIFYVDHKEVKAQRFCQAWLIEHCIPFKVELALKPYRKPTPQTKCV